MKYTCSMETVQQNGCFTLFSSKFHSNIYSILFGPIVSPPIPSISYSTLSVLSYPRLLRPYHTQPSPSYRISTYSVHSVLNPLRPIVSPPTPYISYSTLSVLLYYFRISVLGIVPFDLRLPEFIMVSFIVL